MSRIVGLFKSSPLFFIESGRILQYVFKAIHNMRVTTVSGFVLCKLPWHYSPLRARASQPTAGLTSDFPQTEVKDHTPSLGVTCDQHVESPSRCWLFRQESSLKIYSKCLTILGWHRSNCPSSIIRNLGSYINHKYLMTIVFVENKGKQDMQPEWKRDQMGFQESNRLNSMRLHSNLVLIHMQMWEYFPNFNR